MTFELMKCKTKTITYSFTVVQMCNEDTNIDEIIIILFFVLCIMHTLLILLVYLVTCV